jgi:hypothetical protein
MIHAMAHGLSWHIAHSLPVYHVTLQAAHGVKASLQNLVLMLV